MDKHPDKIFSDPQESKPFAFDHRVVRVFDDMIRRSIPGYEMVLKALGLVARRHVQDHTVVYDLGCSLGASTTAMRRNIQAQGVQVVGIDTSAPMVERCKRTLGEDNSSIPADALVADARDFPLEPSSLIAMNYVLQFIEKSDRPGLLERIFDALVPGGVFFLSEKVAIPGQGESELVRELYEDFKRSNGYSDLEISQKREALENVLVPQSLSYHMETLKDLGFTSVTPWFQWGPFCSIVAQK